MRQSSSSMPKVGCNDYRSNSSSLCIDGWNKSVILARKEDNNTKEEAAGWPRWETASSQSYKQNSRPADTYEDDPTTSKRGWNDSKDSYARVTSEGSGAIHHDVLDGWREFSCNIHVVDKGNLSKSAGRNRSADGNEIRECDGWLGDMSKTPRHFTSPQSRKGYWNQSKGRTTSADDFTVAFKRGWKESGDGKEEKENDGDACDHVGHDGWNQTSTKIYIVDKGNLSKSASWDQTKDDNEKIKNDGWSKWPGVMSKTIRQCASDKNRKGCWNQFEGRATSEDGSPMSYRRGWNESGDGKEKRESADNIGCDGWRQSSSNIHIADKGSFRKSASWDRAEDDNMKGGNDGWSRWPGAMSTTIGEDPNVKRENYEWSRWPGAMSKSNGKDENVKRENDGCPRWPGAMSKSIGEDGNVKRDNDGWPKWPGAMSKTIGQFSSNQNRKVSLQSQRGASVDSDMQKEPVGRNPDFVQNGYSWMQRGSVMSPKCDWNKPIAWNASKGNGFDRDHRKWDPIVDQTSGSPWKQISPIVPPKAGKRKFFHGENSIRRKCKWSVASDFSGPYASMQHRSRSASMSSTKEQCSSSQNRKGGWNQSWGRITSEDDDSLEDNFFQNEFKLRHHIGDAVGKHPDRDTEEFWGSKKPRYLGHDRSIRSFEDPWNQWDPWSHGSRNEGAEKHNFFQNDTSSDGFLRERFIHDDDLECPVKNKSKEIYHDRRDFVPCFVSCVGSRRDNDVPSEGFRELDVQFCKEFHSSRQSMYGMLQNESSDTCDQNNNGKLSSWIGPMDPETCLRDSPSQSHLRRDYEGFRDDTTKSMVTIPMQNEDQKVTKSPNVLLNQQKPLVCQESTQILRDNDQTDHTGSPIQFGQSILVSPRLPSRAKSSNSNDQRVQPDSNPKAEVQNQEQQQAVLNGESRKKSENILYTSITQELNILPFTGLSSLQPFSSTACVSSSDAAFANKDSSSSNLRSRFPPAIIGEKTYKTPEKIKISSKDEILGSSPHFVKQEAKLTSGICDFSQNFIKSCHSEPVEAHANDEDNSSKYEKGEAGANGKLKLKGGVDEKGIRMFKFALAEFVKEIIKPLWKEGRLSKEAHKTLVKKVVEKVVGVLGPKTPQTQERIDLYLSYAKDKLHKLVQDYQEMFINT